MAEESCTYRTAPRRTPRRRRRSSGAGRPRRSSSTSSSRDLLGSWQHMTLPLSAFDEDAFEEGLGFDGSSIRGWQGISESGHAARCRRPTRRSSTRSPRRRRSRSSARSSTRSRASPTPSDPRRIAQPAEEYLAVDRHRRHRATSAPRAEFFIFDSVAYDMQAEPRATTRSTRPKATGTPGEPGPRLHASRHKEGYFPPSPTDTLHDMRTEMVLTLESARHPVRVPPPRGRHRRPVRDRHALRDADPHGRPGHDLQVRRQERRPAARQDRDVHAEAALRRQRLGHALPPVALEGRRRR